MAKAKFKSGDDDESEAPGFDHSVNFDATIPAAGATVKPLAFEPYEAPAALTPEPEPVHTPTLGTGAARIPIIGGLTSKRITQATDKRVNEIHELIADLKGKGMQIQFDEWGSVTFKRGVQSESVHTSTHDAAIRRIAKRVAGVR